MLQKLCMCVCLCVCVWTERENETLKTAYTDFRRYYWSTSIQIYALISALPLSISSLLLFKCIFYISATLPFLKCKFDLLSVMLKVFQDKITPLSRIPA